MVNHSEDKVEMSRRLPSTLKRSVMANLFWRLDYNLLSNSIKCMHYVKFSLERESNNRFLLFRQNIRM